VRPLLISRVPAVDGDRLRPQPGSLGWARNAGADRPALGPDLNRGVRMRAQVVEPSRVLRVAPLRRNQDEGVAVLHVDERGGPLDPAPRPDVIKQEHRRSTRKPVADESTGRPIDDGVGTHQSLENRPAAIGKAQGVDIHGLRLRGRIGLGWEPNLRGSTHWSRYTRQRVSHPYPAQFLAAMKPDRSNQPPRPPVSRVRPAIAGSRQTRGKR